MSTKFETSSAIMLPELIRKLGHNVTGLELGVWSGHNLAYLLEQCSNVSMLYGVDPYLPYQDWNRFIDTDFINSVRATAEQNLAHFPTRSKLINTNSVEAAKQFSDNSLDFIFIDGDHSYERCFEDLNLWYSKVRPGGLFSGHDFSLVGVNKAILDFRRQNNIDDFFKVIPNDVWYWIKE
jgi:hypothetical protein